MKHFGLDKTPLLPSIENVSASLTSMVAGGVAHLDESSSKNHGVKLPTTLREVHLPVFGDYFGLPPSLTLTLLMNI